jgi:DNA adenine methylase
MGAVEVVAKPFLKWVGGKTALLPEILPRLPKKIRNYYEPFIGGGAVFFALAAEKRFTQAILTDANEDLVNAYYGLKNYPKAVIEKLKDHAASHCERYYYEVREQNPRKLSTASRAARLIYLNRTGFNVLYRVNKKGAFNVPFGRYSNPTICAEANLRAVSEILQPTFIALDDFGAAMNGVKKGDVVYFDPPYVPLSDTSNFTSFTKGGFGEENQIRLRDCFKKLDERGVHVLLSNSDAPLVRKLYKGFRIEKVQAPRRVNSKGDKRGNVTELLISGKNGR